MERYQALEQEKILSDAKWQDEITVAYRTNEKAMQVYTYKYIFVH